MQLLRFSGVRVLRHQLKTRDQVQLNLQFTDDEKSLDLSNYRHLLQQSGSGELNDTNDTLSLRFLLNPPSTPPQDSVVLLPNPELVKIDKNNRLAPPGTALLVFLNHLLSQSVPTLPLIENAGIRKDRTLDASAYREIIAGELCRRMILQDIVQAVRKRLQKQTR